MTGVTLPGASPIAGGNTADIPLVRPSGDAATVDAAPASGLPVTDIGGDHPVGGKDAAGQGGDTDPK
jgi:hypothetical protein